MNTDQHLNELFGEPSLQDAYSQVHDTWVSCEPNSQEGKAALEAKREVISVMFDEGIAPGQVDGDLIPDVDRGLQQAELDELRRELGIFDVEEQWQPTTLEEVDRIGNKFIALDEEEGRIKKQFANRMKSVENRRNYLDYRYSKALEAYRAANAPKGKKFVDLPSCRLQSRAVAEHWKVYDEKLLQESLKSIPPRKREELNLVVDVQTTIKSTDKMKALQAEAERRLTLKKAADAQREAFGEVVECEPLILGLQKVPATEKFSVGVAR